MNRVDVLRRLSERRDELGGMGVTSLLLFGSVARGDDDPQSDVDLLVEFDRPVGLLAFARLNRYLSELLETRVDLVTLDAVKPSMRERVLKEAIRAA